MGERVRRVSNLLDMQIRNLAIVRWKCAIIENSVIQYKPSKSPRVTDVESPAEIVTIRSDQIFSSWKLKFSFKYHSLSSGVFAILRSFEGGRIFCGYSRSQEKFLIWIDLAWSMHVKVSAGSLSNYKKNTNIEITVEVKGSSIKMFVNKILFCETDISIKDSQVEFQIVSEGEVELNSIELDKEQPKIFVVMQFSEEYNALYSDVIKPVSEEFGYECIRADDYYASTPILTDIIESIQKSTAIIADITPDNPNVFYEIGYSHAVGKPTILLCDRKREKLPFDVSSFRTLFYENTIAGKKKVEANLRKYLESLS